MSRSGYTEDHDDRWAFICYRGAVESAFRGRRGQAFLRETLAALDAMPIKELAADSLVTDGGQVCTLGAVGAARELDMASLDQDDFSAVASAFGIAEAMAREIVWMNDEVDSYVHYELHGPRRLHEYYGELTAVRPSRPAERWQRMREWIAGRIVESEVRP